MSETREARQKRVFKMAELQAELNRLKSSLYYWHHGVIGSADLHTIAEELKQKGEV